MLLSGLKVVRSDSIRKGQMAGRKKATQEHWPGAHLWRRMIM